MKVGNIETIAGLRSGIRVFQGLEVTVGKRPNIIMFRVDDLNTWLLGDRNRYSDGYVVHAIQ